MSTTLATADTGSSSGGGGDSDSGDCTSVSVAVVVAAGRRTVDISGNGIFFVKPHRKKTQGNSKTKHERKRNCTHFRGGGRELKRKQASTSLLDYGFPSLDTKLKAM